MFHVDGMMRKLGLVPIVLSAQRRLYICSTQRDNYPQSSMKLNDFHCYGLVEAERIDRAIIEEGIYILLICFGIIV